MGNAPTFNAALKLAILTSGQTQTDIARKTDIHESRLSRIIRGHMEASDDEKKRIARALRAPAEELFPAAEASA